MMDEADDAWNDHVIDHPKIYIKYTLYGANRNIPLIFLYLNIVRKEPQSDIVVI